MNMLADELDATQIASPHLRAFLRLIRVGEGTPDDEGFRRIFGGELFTSFADHPRKAITKRHGSQTLTSTAAGAYQFLSRTWDECAKALDLPDFGPRSQTIAACFLIRRRGAMPDVLAGRFVEAIRKCNGEWASLPESPYGQPTLTMARAARILAEALAAEGDSGAALPPPPPSPPPSPIPPPKNGPPGQEEPRMPIPAIIATLGKVLISAFAPLAAEKLQKEIARHTDKPEIAEQITAAVVQAAKDATGLSDPIEAVAAAKKDAEIMAQIEESTIQRLEQMGPLLDRLAVVDAEQFRAEEESRDSAAERAESGGVTDEMGRVLAYGGLALALALTLFVGAIVTVQIVQTGDASTASWAALTGIIGWVTAKVGSIYDYRFGSSRGSAVKQAVLSEISRSNARVNETRAS